MNIIHIVGYVHRMEKKGKNENMQKNAYIKYMCWLYYKFERVFAKIPGKPSCAPLVIEI